MLDLSDRNYLSGKIKIGKEVLYLTQEECQSVGLTIDDVMKNTKDALLAHGTKNYEMPAKIGIHPLPESFFHAMPAYVSSKHACGMKWVECFPKNYERFQLPQTSGLLILNDEYSGWPLAIMDATWITAMRTPAVTALTILAVHSYTETFGMFGCGVQGKKHVEFMAHSLGKLKKIYIYDIREEAMDELISDLQPKTGLPILKGKNPQEVVENCEVMSSATQILREPQKVVKEEWVRDGQTILPCDLNTFWDPLIAGRADKYIVDSIEEHELFAKMGYFPDGLPKIYGETGEIIAGLKEGRDNKKELIVVSNIGMAVEDVSLGREVLNRALEMKIGRKLPL